jgi:ATP-dependent 26S proteasome regulatory subunit
MQVQRTMLELLNQLDGFSSDDRIKVMGPGLESNSIRAATVAATARGSKYFVDISRA